MIFKKKRLKKEEIITKVQRSEYLDEGMGMAYGSGACVPAMGHL